MTAATAPGAPGRLGLRRRLAATARGSPARCPVWKRAAVGTSSSSGTISCRGPWEATTARTGCAGYVLPRPSVPFRLGLRSSSRNVARSRSWTRQGGAGPESGARRPSTTSAARKVTVRDPGRDLVRWSADAARSEASRHAPATQPDQHRGHVEAAPAIRPELPDRDGLHAMTRMRGGTSSGRAAMVAEWVDADVPDLLALARWWTCSAQARYRKLTPRYGWPAGSSASAPCPAARCNGRYGAWSRRGRSSPRSGHGPAVASRSRERVEVPAPDRRPCRHSAGRCALYGGRSLAFGPGDCVGEPYRLDDEKRRVWRLYEVYPRDHSQAGRRRFRRAALSLREGSAKTELGAAITAVGSTPRGRCAAMAGAGRPRLAARGRRGHRPLHPLAGLHRGAVRDAGIRRPHGHGHGRGRSRRGPLRYRPGLHPAPPLGRREGRRAGHGARHPRRRSNHVRAVRATTPGSCCPARRRPSARCSPTSPSAALPMPGRSR